LGFEPGPGRVRYHLAKWQLALPGLLCSWVEDNGGKMFSLASLKSISIKQVFYFDVIFFNNKTMPNNIIHFILSILMSLLHILRIPQPWLQAQDVFMCLY
jgi:hypothetical protein